jgi:hypothetical protein
MDKDKDKDNVRKRKLKPFASAELDIYMGNQFAVV